MSRIITLMFISLFLQKGFTQDVIKVKNQESLLMTSNNCVEAGDFALWIGSDKGINRIEIENDSIKEVSTRQTTKPVLSICDDNKHMWVGIKGKGLYLFNKTTYIFKGKFKREIGQKDIATIKKKGSYLYLKTDDNKTFIVDLADTSIKESNRKQTILEEVNGKVTFKQQVFSLSPEGQLQITVAEKSPVAKKEELHLVTDGSLIADERKELKLKTIIKTEVNSPEEPISEVSESASEKQCDEQSLSYFWMLIPALLLYTLTLIRFVSRKYKRDIRVLEDELLKTKK